MSKDAPYVVSADIGGSHITCCAADVETGQVLEDSTVEFAVDGQATKSEILDAWAGGIRAVAERRSPDAPAGVGFAMPGAFDYRTGVAAFRGNGKFDSLFGVDVGKALTDILGWPAPMRFINDATAFAVGTAWRGAGQPHRRLVAITLGTGFGSAFIDGGVPVAAGDRVPEHGCLWHLPYRDGIADDYVSTRWFEAQYTSLTGRSVRGVKAIAEHAGTSPEVTAIFTEYGRNLGTILAPWMNTFEAQALILGGNVTGAIALFAPALTDVLSGHDLRPEIAVCPLGETAALLGAARLFEADFWMRVKDELPRI